MRGIVPFVADAGIDAALTLGGIVAARKIRGFTGQAAGTIMAALIEAGAGVAGGLLVSRFNRRVGEGIARGGLLAPMMTLVQQAKIPQISDALGDDGFYLGDGLGAYPDDVGGYIGAGAPGGGFVPGATVGDISDNGMGGYIGTIQ